MFVVTTKKKIKKYIKAGAFLLVLLLLVVYFFTVAYPLVLNISEAKAKALVMNTINKAADNIRKFEGFYGKFYTYQANSEGEIVLVSANTAAINNMYLFAQAEIQRQLNDLQNRAIEIPLGAFSGSSILAEYGPAININIVLVGTTEAVWNSYFYNEGINQTIHRLVLRLTTKINILIPAKTSNLTIFTDIILAEDIILGRVPDSYITGFTEDNIFDLLP
ncbi:MAG: sporulation protein YunB [Clostridia bacterium]